jgi:GNAT superfamily N-acetyltransferase
MLDPRAISIASDYWASFFNCPVAELFTSPIRVSLHGPELEGYWGAYALFRDGKAMVSIPPGSDEFLAESLADPARLFSPVGFAEAFAPLSAFTIGSAYLGYAPLIHALGSSARALSESDTPALGHLKDECDATEWDHGGSSIEHPCSGVFADGQLASLAGYETWGGTIAHISIITHPDFRGHGYARDAVAHLANRALASGLLPQYRTLESNAPSIRVAQAVGFSHYASSVAVRLSAEGKAQSPPR